VNSLEVLRPGVLVCSPGVFHGFSEAPSALPQKKALYPLAPKRDMLDLYSYCSTALVLR
jgi:hypothetical protein